VTAGPAAAEQLPLFPLGSVLVPGMRLALHVFEPRYRQLVADLLNAEDPGAPEFGVVALRHGWEVGELGDIYPVGTTARVTDVLPHPDGRCELAAVGEQRFAVEAVDTTAQPYLMATVRRLPEPDGELRPGLIAATLHSLDTHLQALAELAVDFGDTEAVDELDRASPQATALSYAVAGLASLPLPDRQTLLAIPDTASRLRAARAILRRENELLIQLHAIPVTAATFRAGR
jgi:uncharacterized protein